MSLPGYSPLPAVYRACLKHAKAHGAREEDLATSSSYRKFRELALEDRLPGVIRLGQWWGQDAAVPAMAAAAGMMPAADAPAPAALSAAA